MEVPVSVQRGQIREQQCGIDIQRTTGVLSSIRMGERELTPRSGWEGKYFSKKAYELKIK